MGRSRASHMQPVARDLTSVAFLSGQVCGSTSVHPSLDASSQLRGVRHQGGPHRAGLPPGPLLLSDRWFVARPILVRHITLCTRDGRSSVGLVIRACVEWAEWVRRRADEMSLAMTACRTSRAAPQRSTHASLGCIVHLSRTVFPS